MTTEAAWWLWGFIAVALVPVIGATACEGMAKVSVWLFAFWLLWITPVAIRAWLMVPG